jgi:hypothetical protein
MNFTSHLNKEEIHQQINNSNNEILLAEVKELLQSLK